MINIDHVYFSYQPNAPYILEDVNLHVRKGAYISIVGENGCGKSTLLRLMLGFLQPTKGHITCNTKNLRYVSQKNDFATAGFPITVEEILNAYRHLLKITAPGEVDRVLALTDMTVHKKQLIGQLSGGQQQRVALARALIGQSELIFLDEPSTGVDRVNQQEIYSLLKQLNTEQGITILSVEHNLDAALTNSTCIFHMTQKHGHLCTPEQYAHEILHHPKSFAECEVCPHHV